jgi:hypothetical protein
MHVLAAVPAALPSGWVDGLTAVLVGGALVPVLLSVLPDALALGIQRGRWRLLIGLLAANGAAVGCLSWMLSLAMNSRSPYQVDWPEFVELLFGVGMVVALWHGLPRLMRAVRRRHQEDRDRSVLDPAIAAEDPSGTAEPAPPAPAAGPRLLAD